MKKLLLTGLIYFCLTMTVVAANSPVDQGSIILGGTLGFSTQSGELYENMDGEGRKMFAFMPTFGYFFESQGLIGTELRQYVEGMAGRLILDAHRGDFIDNPVSDG